MLKLTWPNLVYTRLLQFSRQGALHAHLASLAAGLLALVCIRPIGLPPSPPVSLKTLLGSIFCLTVLLLLAGPLLNVMHPVFRAAGRLPGALLGLTALFVFMGWRYIVGRNLLRAFEQVHGA